MSDTDSDDPKPKHSLTDADITTERGLNRRSMLRGVGVGGLGLGLAACAPEPLGPVTDIDNGSTADPAGFGRGEPLRSRSGVTDADFGSAITDRVGYGRGGT